MFLGSHRRILEVPLLLLLGEFEGMLLLLILMMSF